jgi:hypothetical protein
MDGWGGSVRAQVLIPRYKVYQGWGLLEKKVNIVVEKVGSWVKNSRPTSTNPVFFTHPGWAFVYQLVCTPPPFPFVFFSLSFFSFFCGTQPNNQNQLSAACQ